MWNTTAAHFSPPEFKIKRNIFIQCLFLVFNLHLTCVRSASEKHFLFASGQGWCSCTIERWWKSFLSTGQLQNQSCIKAAGHCGTYCMVFRRKASQDWVSTLWTWNKWSNHASTMSAHDPNLADQENGPWADPERHKYSLCNIIACICFSLSDHSARKA